MSSRVQSKPKPFITPSGGILTTDLCLSLDGVIRHCDVKWSEMTWSLLLVEIKAAESRSADAELVHLLENESEGRYCCY